MKRLIFIGIAIGLMLSSCENRLGNGNEIKNSDFATSRSGSEINNSTTAYGSIIPIANKHTPRAAHSATLLTDGKVLICGGFAGSSYKSLSSAEIYDPSSRSFTKITDLSTPRVSHSATLLPNGKVLIAGGYNGQYLSSTEIFDPQSKTFLAGPELNTARHGHTATILNDGNILLAGGVGTGWKFLSSAEVYNKDTNTFNLVNSMKLARESHTATLLTNGDVLITGGHRDRRENLKVYAGAEIYDHKANQFKATGDMNIPRHKHDAVLLADGKVLINGGADKRDSLYTSAEIYDPSTSKFISISNMNFARYKHKGTSILLSNDNVLISGGSNKAEIYNSEIGKFVPIRGSLGSIRRFSSSTLLNTGEVLITGGYDDNIRAISEGRLFVKNIPQ